MAIYVFFVVRLRYMRCLNSGQGSLLTPFLPRAGKWMTWHIKKIRKICRTNFLLILMTCQTK